MAEITYERDALLTDATATLAARAGIGRGSAYQTAKAALEPIEANGGLPSAALQRDDVAESLARRWRHTDFDGTELTSVALSALNDAYRRQQPS